jgi:uncharacterized membrane protein YsdA (DUF1294 family)
MMKTVHARQLAGILGAGVIITLLLWPSIGPWRGWLVAVNAVAFAAYGIDKYQSRQSGGRVSEAALYVLALLGGTVGSILGQQAFSHKTRKSSFRRVFWLIAIGQAVALTLWLTYR